MRIAHIITRMILGGAQENTLLSCEGIMRRHGAEVLLVTGPAIGPEGSLIERGRAGGVPIEIVPELRRAIHPWRDWRAYWRGQQGCHAVLPGGRAPPNGERGNYRT